MFQPTHLAMLLICALLAMTTNVAGLLMASMVLQGGSVLNVVTASAKITGTHAYGVTVFHAMALVVVITAAWRYLTGPRPVWPRHLKWPFWLLLLYVAVAVTGAWFLPRLFAGKQVHDTIKMYGTLELSNLGWNFGHAAQILTLILMLAVLVSVWFLCRSPQERFRLLSGVVLGCILVLTIGGYEQIATHFDWPSMASFWANNPGYQQTPLAPMGFVVNRVGLPFSEPSYASAYMATMLVGTLAMALMGQKWWWWGPVAIICAAGLINTLGSTGLAAAGVGTSILFIWIIIKTFRRSTSMSRRWRAAFLCFLFITGTIWVIKDYEGSKLQPHLDAMIKGLIVNKITATEGTRALNNRRAFEIFQETRGLGVGMGSHRASSFFATLLANTGIVGFLLFIGMLITLLVRYWRAQSLTDSQIFVAAALPTATLAMGLGIPDLNMPMYWGFIILGFVFCPDDAQIWGHAGTHKDDNPAATSQVSAEGQDS
jgi:hypothetical protein